VVEATVKVSVLELLEKESKRYSDLVKDLRRPDKTIYVALTGLAESKFISKDGEGRYILTDAGRRELERIRFVRVADEEDDLGIITNTRMAMALGRCYDLLFDLRYLLSRTFRGLDGEDRSRVKEKLVVTRNLLLKYNPSMKREELERSESKGTEIRLTELLSGGILWEKRFIKWGLKDRYIHLLNLAKELPEGPVKDEISGSLALFREVAGKLDASLRGLEHPTEPAI
jgi:DNA-binding PadR family transcriptional regulator